MVFKGTDDNRMRVYPNSDTVSMLEKANHIYVVNRLTSEYDSRNWRVVHHEYADHIEVDKDTPEHQLILTLQEAEKEYPPLSETLYSDMEYGEMLKAIGRKARRTGTIIVDYDAAYDCLSDASVEVVEDSPQVYTVLCSDKDFKETIENAFEWWSEY